MDWIAVAECLREKSVHNQEIGRQMTKEKMFDQAQFRFLEASIYLTLAEAILEGTKQGEKT